MWSLSHPDYLDILGISSGWLVPDALCHPDDLAGVGISSGRVTANSLYHPDDILSHLLTSGWLNWGWYLIQMSFGNVIMSSEWHTLPFLRFSTTRGGPSALPYGSAEGPPRVVAYVTYASTISHPDEILGIAKSSGWLRDQILVISSGWHKATS